MKKLLTILFALAAIAGQAKIKIWTDVVTGYNNAPMISINKVVFAEDHTELGMRITYFKGRQ